MLLLTLALAASRRCLVGLARACVRAGLCCWRCCVVFALRSLAFLARVIPVLGSFAHAAISTGLFLWLMARYGPGCRLDRHAGRLERPGRPGHRPERRGARRAGSSLALARPRTPGGCRRSAAAGHVCRLADSGPGIHHYRWSNAIIGLGARPGSARAVRHHGHERAGRDALAIGRARPHARFAPATRFCPFRSSTPATRSR